MTFKKNQYEIFWRSNYKEECISDLSFPIYCNIGEYSENQLQIISNLILKKHYEYNCGIPLRRDIHETFHKLYGYKNNTKIQFIDFLNQIKNDKLEIPYWAEKDESYKKLIDEKINLILSQKATSSVAFLNLN
jgi:hypothetical protein